MRVASFLWTQSLVRDAWRRSMLFELDMTILKLRHQLGVVEGPAWLDAALTHGSVALRSALERPGLMALLLLPIVGLFFHLEPDVTLLAVAGITLLTCFGFSAAGTLFAALTVQTRARDLMLSVVVFPLVTPTLLAGVLAAREVLSGAPLSEALDWMLLLGACDVLFLSAGVLLFDTLLSE